MASADGAPAPGSRRADPFRTDHLLPNLKGRSIRGSAQTIAAQSGKFVIHLGSTMVLARVLTPGDFGLVAMATIVVGFVVMFKDAGLSMATIQSPTVTHDQVSAMFWVNACIGVALAGLVAASAPLLAWVYGEPRLVGITIAMAATLLVGGAAVQHHAILRRQMRFGTLVTIDVISMACGVVAAVAIALATRSYWALVANPIVTTVVSAAGTVVASGWRPSGPRRGARVGSMLKFGGNLTVASFLTHATHNVDKLLLGYVHGASVLGVYRAAYELVMLPIRLQQGPVASVMLPALSRLQGEAAKFRSAYLRVMSVLALGGGPVAAFLFVEAGFLVRVVLGPQWDASAGVLRAFVPAALVGILYSAPRYLMITTGRSGLYARTAGLELAIVGSFAMAALAMEMEPVVVASVVSAGSVAAFLVSTRLATRHSMVTMGQVATHLGPHVVSTVAAVAAGEAVRRAGLLDGPAGAAVSAAVIASAYLAALALFPRGRWSLAIAADGLRGVLKRRRAAPA